MSTRPSHSMVTGPRELRGDQQGAILVIGLFAAIFIVGVLYYLLGFGQALRHGERMQDAADSVTFATSVMHARAMNLMALLNMVKLAVVVVLAGLLSIMAAAVATIAWIQRRRRRRLRYGWTIPFLLLVLVQAEAKYAAASAPGEMVLRAADRAQRVLRDRLPEIAVEKARREVLPAYAPPARDLFASPAPLPLPTEESTPTELCARALSHGARMGHRAFSAVPSGTIRGRARRTQRDRFSALCMAERARPHRITDPRLGGERYQIRLVVLGQPLDTLGEQGVRTAAFMADEDPGHVGRLRDQLSRVSFAQGEYYFEGPQIEAEMLWHMEWRARLRRYRAPAPAGLGAVGAGGDEWVVH
jgi:hypothetical protein